MTDKYGHVTPPSVITIAQLQRLERMGHQPVRYGNRHGVYRCAKCHRYATVSDNKAVSGSMFTNRCV